MTTYVTVAIPYVNAEPHLGYAYELVQADVYARSPAARRRRRAVPRRHRRLLAEERARRRGGRACRRPSSSTPTPTASQPLAEPLGAVVRRLHPHQRRPAAPPGGRAAVAGVRGDAATCTSAHYEGDYCVGCEQFYDRDELADGRCPEHGTPLERVAEENWFFRLSAYQDHLERADHVRRAGRSTPSRSATRCWPSSAPGSHDISVSRSVERARGWGIAVPDDPTQVDLRLVRRADQLHQRARASATPTSADYRRWWLRLRPARARHRQGHPPVPRRVLAGVPRVGRPAAADPHPGASLPHRRRRQAVEVERRTASTRSTSSPTYGTDALRWWFARDVGDVADTDFTVERLVAGPTTTSPTGSATSPTGSPRSSAGPAHRGITVADTEPIEHIKRIELDVGERLRDFDLRAATASINDAVGAVKPISKRRRRGGCSTGRRQRRQHRTSRSATRRRPPHRLARLDRSSQRSPNGPSRRSRPALHPCRLPSPVSASRNATRRTAE